MKAIEDVDVEKLVTVCKQVNEVIDAKIEVVGVATVDLIKSFTAALEAMPDAEQDKVVEAVDFYNDLYKDEAGDPAAAAPAPVTKIGEKEEKKEEKKEEEGKKKAEKKKKKAPAAKKKKAPPKQPVAAKERDAYGFGIGTKNNQFMEAIKAQPMKMSEVKDLPWNEKKVTFYEVFKKQKEAGKAELDAEGRMCVK